MKILFVMSHEFSMNCFVYLHWLKSNIVLEGFFPPSKSLNKIQMKPNVRWNAYRRGLGDLVLRHTFDDAFTTLIGKGLILLLNF